MSQFVTDEKNPHLGGACVGGDPATFYPALWTWLVEEYQVRSVIDVGCGEGHALRHFETLGCEVIGIEGVQQDYERIIQHDYTQRPYPDPDEWSPPERLVDLVWCCEFVEHVEERYVPNFLATFACAEVVLMTHAFPGQPGWHHVNLHSSPYWVGAMAAIGYQYDDVLTAATRELARANTDPNNHYVRSGLAFKRYE